MTDTLDRLNEIKEQLEELSLEARELVRENFPERMAHSDAYGVFNFGSSSNPYDSTFETLIDELNEEL